MDRVTNIIAWAGIACFVFSVLLSGLYPYMITDAKHKEATILEVANPPTPDFRALKESYPVAFKMAYPTAGDCLTDRELATMAQDDPRRAKSEKAWVEAHAMALQRGRDVYIGEACWHCHSQFVRPVANEEQRFGRIRTTRDDNNALQRPVLWGTRRVGPDLTNLGGRRSNDWHVAHFENPRGTSPGSVMPTYPWFFRKGFEVRRLIDSDTAEMESLDSARTYAYPGVYATRAEAEKVAQDLVDNPPPNLEDEVENLSVAETAGPTADALSLIAYLQWLGTWEPERRESAQ
jgi:cbb3-type cytochrome c oxidase subunit II